MPNSATLVQALGAAFCAILCAFHFSSFGGGGMMIGARTAAWAKSVYTAKDYVQDGLIAMWDGIENAGWGVHDPNRIIPVDLKGNVELSQVGTCSSGDNFFRTEPGGYLTGTCDDIRDAIINKDFTVELVMKSKKIFNGGIFSVSSGVRLLWFWSSNSYEIHTITILGGATSPDFAYSDFASMSIVGGMTPHFYFNFDSVYDLKFGTALSSSNGVYIGSLGTSNPDGDTTFRSVRLYSRSLTDAEIAANYAIDKARFNLPDAA